MKLSKVEFDVLTKLVGQNKLEYTGFDYPDSKIEETVISLTGDGFIRDGKITEKGLTAIEPYKVKRAVFMAAGLGSRLAPVTLKTPKPLVKVNGVRIIDTLIDAVLRAGINEIYIVRGYLAKEFDVLHEKYPMIRFIENPLYNVTNNISSGYAARNLYSNAYILEADLYLNNPDLITPYQYDCNYLGIPVKETEDWCLELEENGRVRRAGKVGRDCYQIVGITHWTKDAGDKLEKDIDAFFNSGNPDDRQIFWGTIPLIHKNAEYNVYVRTCRVEDATEIDTFDELKAVDKSYENYKA